MKRIGTLLAALAAVPVATAPSPSIAATAATEPMPATLKMPDFRQPHNVRKLQPGEACNECGYVQSVREVALETQPANVPTTFQGSSRGVVDHNLVGAVLYLPLSTKGSDKPFIGAVGTPEMRERFGNSTYAVTVKLDNDRIRVVQRQDGSRFQPGDRVRMIGPSDLELVME